MARKVVVGGQGGGRGLDFRGGWTGRSWWAKLVGGCRRKMVVEEKR